MGVMARWSTLYSFDFHVSGPWEIIDNTSAGEPIGPITIVDDGGDSAGQAQGPESWEAFGAEVPFDPQTLYEITIRMRTATEPDKSGGTHTGFTGIDANGKRCNNAGADSTNQQGWACTYNEKPPAAYTDYTGYIYGQKNPGDRGANPNANDPMRIHPNIVKLRPRTRLLYNSTTGQQNVTSYRLRAYTAKVTVNATARPSSKPGMWTVEVSPTTEALKADYDAYRVWMGQTSMEYKTGELPAKMVFEAAQEENTTVTWWVYLYKKVRTDDWVRITDGRQSVSTAADGRSLVINQDGSTSAWVEIQQWPTRERTRQAGTLIVQARESPVVLSSRSVLAASTITFLTRTERDRQRLEDVLADEGPLRIIPACTTLPAPWVMPGNYRMSRLTNRATDERWLTEADIQEINEDSLPAAARRAPADDGTAPQGTAS
ncbi:hypothetical protein [Streptomyces alboflavus]|uniref:hypothetical protein n=1 Tax=Streptomyces alboflavus TaxID=67267 RepID=UPI0036BB0E95